MKRQFLLLLLLANAVFLSAPAAAATAAVLKGEVLEVKEVPNYTYLRIKTASGEIWSAVATASVQKGAIVTIENAAQMDNFESKTLKRTFPKIFFGSLAAAPGTGAAQVNTPHSGASKSDYAGEVKVSKASGPRARTVAEIFGQSKELKDKPVLLRARVVKYSAAIMGRNWLHLRDGTGSATASTEDLLATSTEVAKVGDIVLVSGIVRTDKNFGSGYAYKVLIEDAKLQK